MTVERGPGVPTPPIDLSGTPADTAGVAGTGVAVPDAVLDQLRATGAAVEADAETRAEHGRDWWPLAMTWALDNRVLAVPAAVVRPTTVDQVRAIARICHEHRIPLTAAAGRSGVCGSAVPARGGVVLDFCAMAGIASLDRSSMVVDVLPGTFGDALEADLQTDHGVTVGHWPQSMTLSTVGGWLACRGAGQLSNRYGKIEDMVIGLDVVLADGRLIHTGGHARAATGPDLNQLFVGSEGTLGLIVGARLRTHPAPEATETAAFGFPSFAAGLDACRAMTQHGAAPAVQRLYDAVESDRNFQTGPDHAVLLLLDEGHPDLVAARMKVASDACTTATRLDASLVDRWMGHRNEVSQLESLISGGLVVDTMEITGPWAALPAIYDDTVAAIGAVDGTLAVSSHQSHAYTDGACLYFTFAGKPPADQKDAYYRAVWDAGTRAVLHRGGSLSHHHGVGVNRARFMAEALGDAFDVVIGIKDALDPRGILNPGKLGLPDPFGPDAVWP
jgi:alkyldihydroxyacetonephosphate synthase